MELLSALGPLATIAALVLALWQTRLAMISKRESLAIQQSLSTRYLGQFPDYIGDIADLVRDAKSSVQVFCDLPGYGDLSNPEAWRALEHALESKKDDAEVSVSVTLYSESWRRRILEEQVEIHRENWHQWLAKNRRKLETFFRRRGIEDDPRSITSERYIEVSMGVQADIQDQVFGSGTVRSVDRLMPLYFWIVDGRKAVFAIPAYTSDSTEHGFITSDGRIVDALAEMSTRYAEGGAASWLLNQDVPRSLPPEADA